MFVKDGKGMFEIGGYVIYRSEGVCVVSDIRYENFGGSSKGEKYYILSPLNDRKSTVFVPVENEKLVGMMRGLLSASDIEKMIAELRDERLEWIADSRGRGNRFKEILAIGDRRELIVLANTVREKIEATKADGRKPCATDINALRKAEFLLFEEFSATLEIGTVNDISDLLLCKCVPKPKA